MVKVLEMEVHLAYARRPSVITDEGQRRDVMTKVGADSERLRIWAAGFDDGEGSHDPGNVGGPWMLERQERGVSLRVFRSNAALLTS